MANEYFLFTKGRVPIGKSDPERVDFHSEPEEKGFYHDDDGEPFEFWIEGKRELYLNR